MSRELLWHRSSFPPLNSLPKPAVPSPSRQIAFPFKVRATKERETTTLAGSGTLLMIPETDSQHPHSRRRRRLLPAAMTAAT